MGAFQSSDETELEPSLVNGAIGKRCDIDGKPEQVSSGSMRIKAHLAVSIQYFNHKKGRKQAG
jgi:hypothetical protein